MRITLTAGQTYEIKTENAKRVNLSLVSGEINYRVGDNTFADTTDYKLTEDLRTDSIKVGGPTSVHIKAIQNSVFQFRRE